MPYVNIFALENGSPVRLARVDLVNDVGTTILAIANGGTGWANLQANTVLLGNKTRAEGKAGSRAEACIITCLITCPQSEHFIQ